MSEEAAKLAKEMLREALSEGYPISDGLIDAVGDETGLSNAEVYEVLHAIASDAVKGLDLASAVTSIASNMDDLTHAVERIAEQMSRELPEAYTAVPGETDMSAALEAEYHAYLADAARALGTHPLITDATSDQENYGDGPQ